MFKNAVQGLSGQGSLKAVCIKRETSGEVFRRWEKDRKMKTGKLPENVLKRSVFRQLHIKRDDVLIHAGVGADCTALKFAADEAAVLSSDPVIWTNESDGRRAVYAVCNDLACSGAQPVGLLLTALLPPEIEEPQIREMVRLISEQCEPLGIQILGGHTEITPAVNLPVISVTGVGKVKEDLLIPAGNVCPGDDIIVTKWIALEGTWRIAQRKKEELSARYPMYMLEDAAGFEEYMSVLPEAALAAKSGVRVMHDISEGGVFGALWEMAESSGIGLEIDLRKIPLRQETVEICDFYGLNPYQLVSGGSMLMASSDGNALVHILEQQGIPAVVIGKAAQGNDRILVNEEERRFLEPPKTDEIHKLL